MTDYPTSLLPDRGRCTGCGACASGCPKGAIHMLPDREGFLYPTVTDACIQCGHCAHICPVLKQREPRPEPAVFAAWNPDASVRQASTAGGVFPLLAEYILDEGGVVFGAALDQELRVRHMEQIAQLPCDGFAIGGLAVGEPTQTMYDIIDAVEPHMPREKPRYLMGVGTPSNIIEGVARGIDFFDCVMPARNARHGKLFTWEGTINIKNEKYKLDDRPIDPACTCPTCAAFSRAYVRHLLAAGEMLAMRLAVMHNLHFYNELMARIRQALDEGRFEAFRAEYSEKLGRPAP